MSILNKNLIDELLRVNNNLIVPSYLIKYISKLDLNIDEFIMIIYFLNHKEKLTFNPIKISNDLYIETNKETYNQLYEKNNGVVIPLNVLVDEGLLSLENTDLKKSDIEVSEMQIKKGLNSTVEVKVAATLPIGFEVTEFLDISREFVCSVDI